MVYVPYDNDLLLDKASHLCYQYWRLLLKIKLYFRLRVSIRITKKNKENSNSWPFFVGRMMYTDIGNKI